MYFIMDPVPRQILQSRNPPVSMTHRIHNCRDDAAQREGTPGRLSADCAGNSRQHHLSRTSLHCTVGWVIKFYYLQMAQALGRVEQPLF